MAVSGKASGSPDSTPVSEHGMGRRNLDRQDSGAIMTLYGKNGLAESIVRRQMARSCLSVFFILAHSDRTAPDSGKGPFPARKECKSDFPDYPQARNNRQRIQERTGKMEQGPEILVLSQGSEESALSKRKDNAGLLMEGRAFPVKEVL